MRPDDGEEAWVVLAILCLIGLAFLLWCTFR